LGTPLKDYNMSDTNHVQVIIEIYTLLVIFLRPANIFPLHVQVGGHSLVIIDCVAVSAVFAVVHLSI